MGHVSWVDSIDDVQKVLLADAQTSGGLLIAVAADKLDDLLKALAANGVETRAVVGRITAHEDADSPAISVIS
jgi:selenide,water dikinase